MQIIFSTSEIGLHTLMICFCYDSMGKKLKDFLDILNHYRPSITFTSKYSREGIDFLDVEIIKADNGLLTNLFVKSTNTHQYLHTTSCHVYHSKKTHTV